MRQGVATLLLLSLALTGCQVLGPPPDSSTRRIEVIDRSEPLPDSSAPGDATTPAPGRVARQVAFPVEEYARLAKHGSASISGRLSLNGTPGTGETIAVAPVTTYSAEAAEQALAGRAVEPADPRARAYTHTTRTDAQGRFQLSGLPSGAFYVSGSLRDPRSGERRIIIRQVELRPGASRQVDLSR